jgi:hypothetical protein
MKNPKIPDWFSNGVAVYLSWYNLKTQSELRPVSDGVLFMCRT